VWSALSTAPWVAVLTPMPQIVEGRVFFRVAANNDLKERTATITVQYRTLTVWQGPGPCKRP